MNHVMPKIIETVKENFRFSTLSFIFIIVYVNIFQLILGPENSIVGVIFTIMMSASMVRDLTATPLKHLFLQALVLVWMAVAACMVNVLPVPLSFFINFITLLAILYTFTYEYSSHMYFPYILSYLFLIFISPVAVEHLPKRILGMLAGALSIILYQWFMGRKRIVETARDVLSEMMDDICQLIHYKLGTLEACPDLSDTRHKLCRLSRTVYDRRKKILCVSDASFSMIDAGRGLEKLLIQIHEFPMPVTEQEESMLLHIYDQLKIFRSYLHQEINSLPLLDQFDVQNDKAFLSIKKTLVYIRDRLLHMTDPQNKTHYRKTVLSLKVRLLAALDLSPVRAIYAVRVALLLSCATLLVQSLALPHGKWLLFTLASVSLPYADDVPQKIKKRITATLLGGVLSVIVYSLIPSSTGRTVVMMFSGYLSFYFSDYTETFTCSTIGALGGAVFMNSFGFQAVGNIFLIRIGYVLAGAVLGYVMNCLLFPYSRAGATRHLWDKYRSVTALLAKVASANEVDSQLFYSLVIQAHLLEEKLTSNAYLEKWTGFPQLLFEFQEQIRHSHRTHIPERKDAAVL